MARLASAVRGFATACGAALLLSACGGGSSGGGASSVPVATASAQPTTPAIAPGSQPTVAPSPAGGTAAPASSYVCPVSASVASIARSGPVAGDAVRRAPLRRVAPAPAPAATQLLAVTYASQPAGAALTTLAAREATLGVTRLSDFTFGHAGVIAHVVSVPAADAARVTAALRQLPGVRSVGPTGLRRFATGVSAPLYPNDPYFTGFATTAATAAGAAPAPTFETGLDESPDVPGQWDMHVTRLEYAWAYSRANNGSGITAPAALGSTAVRIAVIDTGVDGAHPELQSKIAYERCFITNPGNVQSSSAFSTDRDGHGTDVAGIAGAAIDNGLGFAGAGGNVELAAYRVFPTPDDSCASTTSTQSVCSTDTRDIAAAIQDAVAKHVNVISLSLGGSGCTGGADPDPLEGAAVADAIAANIIVVAASGNSGGPPVEAPACDPGVIAVGATALADGQTNGSGKGGGSAAAPFEYVASYSDIGSPGATPGSASAWGIVAPGGDPTAGSNSTSSSDADDLHWIENIWTTTPFAASPSDTSFTGNCSGDYPTQTGTPNCRVLIAGTSMATPHVAGAAALIVSANPAYQSPAAMKQLLCSTADDIGDPSEGCGRLDVYRAMATALGDPAVPAPSPMP